MAKKYTPYCLCIFVISDHGIMGNTSPQAVELRTKYDRAQAKQSEAEEETTWDPSAPQYSRMEGSRRGSRIEVVARNQLSQAIYQILSTKYCNKIKIQILDGQKEAVQKDCPH